jgi:hypothetical protein
MRIPAFKPLTVALLSALALAACGSSAATSSSPAAASATSPATSSTTSTTGSASSSSSSTTQASTSAAAGSAPCRASGLALSFLGGQGATGHGELGFALRNTGSASCRTYGYPGIQFLDKAGGKLPTAPTHTTQDFFGPAPLHALVLHPGQSASFRLGVTHGSGSSAGCTTAYALQVIPPDDTATLSTSITNGAYECGTATVTPLQPGTTASG